ncbi:MAG: hypothetical protein A2V70_19095 [Planctomycetes bacterium RBG_13_63_9]|nr:MAG: hypothetical protein A2V70_19095 [Planctomycetes bacterium RBG_13_63_9]
MPNTSRLRLIYLLYFSQPSEYRPVYRAIHRQQARKILQLGLGIGQTALRMIEVAGRLTPLRQIHFAAVDPFDARSAADGPGVTLKMAHRLLTSTGARVHLVPGYPSVELARVANSLGQVDLLVLSARQNLRDSDRAWFYVPRLLHERSQVFLERLLPGGSTALRLVPRGEIDALAAAAARRRAA